jgi:hypothetical protein
MERLSSSTQRAKRPGRTVANPSFMGTGLAIVTEITHAHQHVWQVNLNVTLPPGAQGFKPEFLNRLGYLPQTIGIPASEAPQPMLVTVLGEPEVQVGEAINFEVAA